MVTGGAGFIGSALCRHLVLQTDHHNVLNLDKLTYAANLASLAETAGSESRNYRLAIADIGACREKGGGDCCAEFRPGLGFSPRGRKPMWIDRSRARKPFSQTNVIGTQRLLSAALALLAHA